MPNPSTRIVVVVNPQTLNGATADSWKHATERWRLETNVCAQMSTSGTPGDIERLVNLIRVHEPDVVVAAGGDGTVSEVVRAIVSSPRRPVLAIVPTGTANNVARCVGLSSFRQHGNAAADCAVEAIVHGRKQRIDLGEVDGRPFVGAFGVGMDADILCTRNRLRRRFGLGREIGGYPLYLWSCAVNVFRTHGGTAELTVNGATRSARFYNLLITNTPIYAGEFRFAAADSFDDGWLDLHLFADAPDYLRRYPAAWRRHVRYERGREVTAPMVERVRELVIENEEPMKAQLDGEELEAGARVVVGVLPAALEMKVPNLSRR